MKTGHLRTLPVTGRIQNADAPLLSELPGGGVLDDMVPAVDRTAITDVDLDSTIACSHREAATVGCDISSCTEGSWQNIQAGQEHELGR